MTVHEIRVDSTEYERVRLNEKMAVVVFRGDRDYQAGDTLRVLQKYDGRYRTERRIAHVGRDVDGLDERYVVLSLADQRVENLQTRLDSMTAAKLKLDRSNAALRGANRRLRNR
ncbi:hypothetical protein SEA_AVOCADO_37 [Mycobacterium phage Avocado]|uniref:DUF3850 domain-containing protein n=1 Tax=Mycobacterium phage Avocado TaxID=2024302 RepID=A0A222YYA0_9CAUD|nr:RNA-binding protein [Mycobacterium phage Avocado]ASR77239.1 hypothetical protein SEA_AVOCADO_37 [Mycobacterium phage Avocado]